MKILAFLQKHHPLVSVLLVILIAQIAEIALIIVKYDIFTGGFLQPYVYTKASEYLIFFVTSIFFDLALYSLFAFIWFSIAKKFNKRGVIVSFYYWVCTSAVIMTILAIKFKLLSYFKDTVNLTILKNLGGGSISGAIAYASNELILAAVSVLVGIAIIYFLAKWLEKRAFFQNLKDQEIEIGYYKKYFFVLLLITPFLCYSMSNLPFYQFGLNKKISYNLFAKTFDTLSDVDFDGYGEFAWPKDSAPFDGERYLQQFETLLDADKAETAKQLEIIAKFSKDPLKEIKPQKGKHILVIVMETARNDLLDKKVKGQFIAPNIRAVMKQGIRVANAYSHTGYTDSSLKALFNRNLSEEKKIPLIQYLDDAQYHLSFFSGQDDSYAQIAEEIGLDEAKYYHFDSSNAVDDRVFPSTIPSSLKISEQRLIKEFKKEVQNLDFNQPQFIYFNLQAGHFPYAHSQMPKRLLDDLIPRSKISAKNKDWVALTYWNALTNADWAVGQIVKILKEYQALNNTTIMILGDHGESLFDNGVLGHGYMLTDIQTQIPLVFNDKKIQIDEVIGQIDLAEMIIRSAFNLTNKWADEDKVVFQLTGNILWPVLIGHVLNKGERVTYDFRTNLFFFSENQKWMGTKEVLKDASKKAKAIRLVLDWKKRYKELKAYQENHPD